MKMLFVLACLLAVALAHPSASADSVGDFQPWIPYADGVVQHDSGSVESSQSGSDSNEGDQSSTTMGFIPY